MNNRNNDIGRMKQSQADTRKMLAEWRERKYSEVELPISGRVLTINDMGILDLSIMGKIPNTLMDLFQDLSDGKVTEAVMMKEHSKEFGELLDAIFLSAVVFPPVAEEPDDDHISPKEFVYSDKMALFNWVNREAKILRPFRAEPIQLDEAIQPG